MAIVILLLLALVLVAALCQCRKVMQVLETLAEEEERY